MCVLWIMNVHRKCNVTMDNAPPACVCLSVGLVDL